MSHSPASPARALSPVHARASWRNLVRARQVLAALRTNLRRQNGRGVGIRDSVVVTERRNSVRARQVLAALRTNLRRQNGRSVGIVTE